jgi:hypothetical protein
MRARISFGVFVALVGCGSEDAGPRGGAADGGESGRAETSAGATAGSSGSDAGARGGGAGAGVSGDAGTPANAGGAGASDGGASDGGASDGGASDGGVSLGGRAEGGTPGAGASGGGPLDGETIGGYGDLDLEENVVYTVDLGVRDYPVYLTENATAEYEPDAGWNGGPSVRVTPPLAGGYGALGGFSDLWKGGTFTIRKLNFRFEVQFGAAFGEHWPDDDLKFVIVHTADALGAETNERPMCNWANASEEGSGILAWAVGAGTVKNFSPPGFEPAYSPSGNEEFYIGPSAGTFNGKPVIGPEQWISIEVEIIAEATAEAPDGRIRSVLTLRDGTELTELEIPWSYDAHWELPSFISEVQVIGGYYNTGTTAAAPENFYRVADHVTFAANRPGLLGPRAGFVAQ